MHLHLLLCPIFQEERNASLQQSAPASLAGSEDDLFTAPGHATKEKAKGVNPDLIRGKITVCAQGTGLGRH